MCHKLMNCVTLTRPKNILKRDKPDWLPVITSKEHWVIRG